MKLIAYGGTEIPNLGSCQVYVKGPNIHIQSQYRQKLLILVALL